MRNCPGRAAAGPPGTAARPGYSARPWGPSCPARLTAGGWQAYLCTTGVLCLVSDLQMLTARSAANLCVPCISGCANALEMLSPACWKPETTLFKAGLNVAED